MGNWDDESEEEVAPKPTTIIVPKRSKFEGEDEEEDVADDWDASSDEEDKAPAPAPVAAPRKKGTLKAAIAAKEAEKARRAAEEEDEEESEVDELEQKRRDKQRELETDMLNATSLLAGSSISANQVAEVQGITNFNPKTKEDFVELSDKLIDLITRHQDKPLYATFVELHVKALAQPLRDVDVRKAASALTTLANEKQKEQRDKTSGKKKPKVSAKPTLGGAKATMKVDTSAYEEALDDFGNDDFM